MITIDRESYVATGPVRGCSDGSYLATEPGDHDEGCCVSELDIRPEDSW